MKVYDGRLYSEISKAEVSCTNCKTQAVSVSDTIRNAIIGAATSGAAGLIFFILKVYLQRKANKQLEQSLTGNDSKSSKEKKEFIENVITPIAEKLFKKSR